MISPPEWHCFPPALCPIWCDPSLPYYLGVWKHWFGSRQTSFVALNVEAGKVYEVARTPEQLFCHFILSAIIIHDDVSPAIKQFASAVGIKNLHEINATSLKSGDDPHGCTAISQFRQDVPAQTMTDMRHYTGDFPTGIFSGTTRWWERSCAFEVPDDILESWPSNIPQPPWLSPGNRNDMFERFLRNGEYFKAWLTLNSQGWSISDAKRAISALSLVANDFSFSLLAKAWISVAEDSSAGYY
jgi:hypothetical protein